MAEILTCLDGVSWRAAIVTGWIGGIDVMEAMGDKERRDQLGLGLWCGEFGQR